MENWTKVFDEFIPKNDYQTKLLNGEEDGLVIELESLSHKVLFSFGAVSATRMIDEGVLLTGHLFNEKELNKYKPDEFKEIIYEIENGEFGLFIKKQYGEMYELLSLKHYLIVTMNYCVEIVTQWIPTLEIIDK